MSTEGPGNARRKPGPASKTGGIRPSRKSLDMAARLEKKAKKEGVTKGRTKSAASKAAAARESTADEDIERASNLHLPSNPSHDNREELTSTNEEKTMKQPATQSLTKNTATDQEQPPLKKSENTKRHGTFSFANSPSPASCVKSLSICCPQAWVMN